jgi:hypothetical protein
LAQCSMSRSISGKLIIGCSRLRCQYVSKDECALRLSMPNSRGSALRHRFGAGEMCYDCNSCS